MKRRKMRKRRSMWGLRTPPFADTFGGRMGMRLLIVLFLPLILLVKLLGAVGRLAVRRSDARREERQYRREKRARWRHRHRFDEMDGAEFEWFCAELLERLGHTHVEVTQESGDGGIDVLSVYAGEHYAIQAKCYGGNVGVKAVQEAYTGRDFYECEIGAVMTNSYFTRQAVNMAEKLDIELWDRDVLEGMIRDAGAL